MAKKKSLVGPVLIVGGTIAVIVGFIRYALDNPEGAGKLLGAYEKATRPRTKVVTKHDGILSSWTEVRYE